MSLTISATSVTERLPSNLGSFKSTEFLMLSNLLYDGVQVLNIWKNMLLAIGNINQIEVGTGFFFIWIMMVSHLVHTHTHTYTKKNRIVFLYRALKTMRWLCNVL